MRSLTYSNYSILIRAQIGLLEVICKPVVQVEGVGKLAVPPAVYRPVALGILITFKAVFEIIKLPESGLLNLPVCPQAPPSASTHKDQPVIRLKAQPDIL